MQDTSDIISSKQRTVFEDLSVELFFELFEFFHFAELCNTFAHLNQRIDNYLAQLPNIYLDLSSTKYILNTTINDDQLSCVKSLKALTIKGENRQRKAALIFQHPLNSFRQLHSLSLRLTISSDDLRIIIDQLPLLPALVVLNIMFDLFQSQLTMDDLRHTCKTIFHSCIALKTLTLTIMDHSDQRKRIHNSPLFDQPIPSSIEYLDIDQLYFNEFDCMLSPLFLPRIKSLSATIYDNPTQRDFPNDKLTFDYLTNLIVNFNWDFTFTYLESIFKRTPNLKSFIITASPITLIDGPKWQYFLSTCLFKVVKFHLHASDWQQGYWPTRNECMNFQTSPYWGKERGGEIQMRNQEALDEEGNEMGSISITFTSIKCKPWKRKCLYCFN